MNNARLNASMTRQVATGMNRCDRVWRKSRR